MAGDVNYFDLIETNTELAKRLLDVLNPPLRVPPEMRPLTQQQIVHPFHGRRASDSWQIYVNTTTRGLEVVLWWNGQPLRRVVWEWSDEPIDLFNERP